MKIRERQKVIDYLKKRQLEKPYLKTKEYFINDQLKIVDFKLRQPGFLTINKLPI